MLASVLEVFVIFAFFRGYSYVWELAEIGDPAYDLAIVTARGRKPLGVTDGRQRLVDFYNEIASQKVETEAVIVLELLFHLNWLAEAAERKRNKEAGGHGPDHFAGLIRGILTRAKTGHNRENRD